MTEYTNRLGLYKPGGGGTGTNLPDEAADIDRLNQNFDKLDAAIGIVFVTSTTHPAQPWPGMMIYETDTQKILLWDEITFTWVEPPYATGGPFAPLVHTHLLSDITRTLLSDEDLDTLLVSGFYDQGAQANATTANHYPQESRAGMLEVIDVGNNKLQRFYSRSNYSDAGAWQRGYRAGVGWAPWKKFVVAGEDGIPYRMAAGNVSGVTVAGGTVVRTTINFPSGRFTQPPVVNPIRTNDYRDITVGVDNVTSTSFDLLRGHTTTTPTRSNVTAAWIAVQMTESSGTG